MAAPWIISAVLIGASVLLDITAIHWVDSGTLSEWPFGRALILALAYSQTSLVTIWGRLMGRSGSEQVTCIILVVACWSSALRQFSFPPLYGAYFVELLSVALLIHGIWHIAGNGNVHLLGREGWDAESGKDIEHSAWHASPSDTGAWIIAFAVVLVVGQSAVRERSLTEHALTEIGESAVFSGWNLLIAFPALWAALSQRSAFRRFFPLLGILVATVAMVQLIAKPSHASSVGIWLVLDGMLIFSALCLFRVAGYRLVTIDRGRNQSVEREPS